MKQIFILVMLLTYSVTFLHGQLIINHLNTDITKLTEAEINLAKSTLHIAYGHTSHGSQVTEGMSGLVGFANVGGKGLSFPNNIFSWNNGGSAGALDLHDYAMGGDVGYYPDWYNNTVNFLNSPSNSDINVIMWSWCGQAASRTEVGMDTTFLAPMSRLETLYPNVKFVYMTGHLDGSGVTGNLHLRNQQIRDYCNANNKILYDFADIESYDPDGSTNYMLLNATDNCDYDSDANGSRDKNWALDWQGSHTQNVDWYSCSCAHSQSLNGNQKAYAAWRMFAEIAKLIKLDEIPAKLTVSDTLVGNTETACFDATDTLTITGEIDTVEFKSGSSVDLIAGKSIFLMPGFHALEGSTTHAFITTDNQYCFAQSSSPAPTPAPVITYKSSSLENSSLKNENLIQEKQVKIFPNPNNGQFTLELTNFENNTNVSIYNMLGERVYQSIATNLKSHKINLPGIKKGIYFLKMMDGKEQFTLKMVVD